LLYEIPAPKTLQIVILGFLLRAAEPVILTIVLKCSLVSFLVPRFPPFFGYFFCRLAQDWFVQDPCRIEDAQFFIIPDFRGNCIVNIIRAMGLLITFVTYASSLWNPVLVVMYEVMPSILLQKRALLQLQTEVSRCAFIHHPDIILKCQLQVLNTMFNNIYSRDVFAICMACVLLILVPMGYFILTIHISPFVLFALSYIMLMAYTVMTIMFSMVASVWVQSTEFNWCWIRKEQFAKKRISRKYGKSLNDLKIKIGSTNFVDKMTPFVFILFCVEQTISLVLMQN
jgi:hypothetical protein